MNPMETTIQNLKSRGFAVSHFAAKEQAAAYLLAQIGDLSVGIGGSVTIDQLGIYDTLKTRGDVFWHWHGDMPKDVAIQGAQQASVYLMSANALSQSGQIINIDGYGNRVQRMCFGHERLYIVCGMNKIAPNDKLALWRARNVAGPKNVRRLGKNAPCAKGEIKCHDCNSPDRICCVFVTLECPPTGIEHVEIILIDEALGF